MKILHCRKRRLLECYYWDGTDKEAKDLIEKLPDWGLSIGISTHSLYAPRANGFGYHPHPPRPTVFILDRPRKHLRAISPKQFNRWYEFVEIPTNWRKDK